MNDEFFITKFILLVLLILLLLLLLILVLLVLVALFCYLDVYKRPATPWSLIIVYFIINFPPLQNIPIVPPPPLISDRLIINVPYFSITIHGIVFCLLW